MSEELLLNTVHSPDDIKNMSLQQLNQLCGEIREKLIETVSQNGGHLASNLGVVEHTIAIHKVFHAPEEAKVWDLGQQC